MIPPLTYYQLTFAIQAAPSEWKPALLKTLVQSALTQGAFIKGGATAEAKKWEDDFNHEMQFRGPAAIVRPEAPRIHTESPTDIME